MVTTYGYTKGLYEFAAKFKNGKPALMSLIVFLEIVDRRETIGSDIARLLSAKGFYTIPEHVRKHSHALEAIGLINSRQGFGNVLILSPTQEGERLAEQLMSGGKGDS